MKESDDDKVQNADEDGWVFDSLVNFLHGPVWKLPVVSFIEDRSVVFDPDSYNNMTSEKEEEYRKTFEEYKGLVDYMLGSFMEDLQITTEQVEDACRLRGHTKRSQEESHVTKVSLEQLWAAEDFSAFRRLMTRKNIDLQLQSLELLVAKYGVLSPSLRNPTDDQEESNCEEDFLQVVLRYADPIDLFQPSDTLDIPCPNSTPSMSFDEINSADDYQSLHHIVSTRNQNQLTKELLAINVNVSPSVSQHWASSSETPSQSATARSQIRRQEETEFREDSSIAKAEKKFDGHISGIRSTKVELNRVTAESIASDAPQQVRLLTSAKKALDLEMTDAEGGVTKVLEKNLVPGSEEEIQQRREYMRAQRDKLVALKRLEREKQLAREDLHGGSSSRPKSARAAKLALKAIPSGSANEKSLAARRAIAERLRQELIEK